MRSLRGCKLAALMVLTGCPASPNVYGASATTGRITGRQSGVATAATTSSSGSAATGSTGTAGSTSGTGATGGSTGTLVLPACDGGFILQGSIDQLPLTADATPQPFAQPIQVVNYFNAGQVADSDDQGEFAACVLPGTSVAWEIVASGYVSMVLATTEPTQSLQLPPSSAVADSYVPTVLQACNAPTLTSQALVIIAVEPTRWDYSFAKVEPSGDTDCASREGWSFVLTDADGGPLDAGLYYFAGTGCGGTSTGPIGIALAEVSPALQQIGVIGTRANNSLPDGGLQCFNASADPHFALTGSAVVASNLVTFIPYVIRASSFAAVGQPCQESADCAGASALVVCPVTDGGVRTCCSQPGGTCAAQSDCCIGLSCLVFPDGGLCQ